MKNEKKYMKIMNTNNKRQKALEQYNYHEDK